ncbi:hypothetical protein GCM10025795_33700 [Verticiella sediminum]
MRVSVCYALPGAAWQRALELPAGSTVRDAIAASGFAAEHPGVDPYAHGIAVFGALRGPGHVLESGERVDILRPLTFDPMESRRRRARHKAAAAAKKAAAD